MTKKEPLKIQISAQGWKQFLTSRNEMLDAYDRAREYAKSHKVETYHGTVAEAKFREWLTNFLPKRYGVTAGYIISQGVSSKQKVPHFDVIIYDAIESPILWIEEHPDTSDAGKSMAIPAEYVAGVLEVKSSFTPTSVKKAVNHLCDLEILMGGIDDADAKYKFYLPPNFFCGLVFFELRDKYKSSEKALYNLISVEALRGFIGGLILRGENHRKPVTGKLNLVLHESQMDSIFPKPKFSLLNGAALSKSIKINNKHIGAMLTWAEPFFSQFAFDLIAIIRGDFEVGKVSSFHGFGASEWENLWSDEG